MLELINKNPLSIELDISTALTTLGKTTSDITDIIFAIKTKKADLDEDAKLLKKLSDDDDITLTSGKYYVFLSAADYVNLVANKTYYIGVGILYDGITTFLELDLNGEDKIQILPDVIRE